MSNNFLNILNFLHTKKNKSVTDANKCSQKTFFVIKLLISNSYKYDYYFVDLKDPFKKKRKRHN